MMKTHACAHVRWLRRHRVGLKTGLLLLPALFWSVVFAALAGLSGPERAVGHMPDPAQILVVVMCPLLALIVGMDAVRNSRGRATARDVERGRMKFSSSRNAGGQMS